MKHFYIILFYNLIIYIKTITVYQCARYGGMKNQCLNQWVDVYGNVKIDLWKCPENFYCHTYPKNNAPDNIIGVCAFIYKKLYDGDSCSSDSECSSLNCTNSKCVGLSLGQYCRPNYYQCANNLVCKSDKDILPYGGIEHVFKCNKLSQINETCENSNECDIQLICAYSYIYNIIDLINKKNINDINELKNRININDYNLIKNNKTKVCVKISSLPNGLPTSDPMICKSGDVINYELFPNYNESICASKKEIIKNCDINNTCIIKANIGNIADVEMKQECMFSVRGNPFCPLNQKEEAWYKYLELYETLYKEMDVEKNRDNDIHIPVYKNTFDTIELSELYWYYLGWEYNIEADSCTKAYFFLKNKATILNKSILYIYITYLILLL